MEGESFGSKKPRLVTLASKKVVSPEIYCMSPEGKYCLGVSIYM